MARTRGSREGGRAQGYGAAPGCGGGAGRRFRLLDEAELADLSIVNLSILKNDRARAIRFSTLRATSDALDCEVGDLLVLAPGD